jgi:hypothetical protein
LDLCGASRLRGCLAPDPWAGEGDLWVRERDLWVKEGDLWVKQRDLQVKQHDLQVKQRDLQVQVRDLQVKERDLRVKQRDLQVKQRDLRVQERDLQVQERDLQVKERDLQVKERDPQVKNENFWVKEPDPSQGSTANSCDERTNRIANPGSLIPSSAEILGWPTPRARKAAFLQPQGVSPERSCDIRPLIASPEVKWRAAADPPARKTLTPRRPSAPRPHSG